MLIIHLLTISLQAIQVVIFIDLLASWAGNMWAPNMCAKETCLFFNSTPGVLLPVCAAEYRGDILTNHQPFSSSDYSLQLGLRPVGCPLDWCEDVKVKVKVEAACLGSNRGSPPVYKVFYWTENKYVVWCWDGLPAGSIACLPPTQAFELQEGWGAVTGPLRLIAERQASSSSSPSLLLPYTIYLTLSPSPCLFSPHSIATNYSFFCHLLLITDFCLSW